MVSIIVNNGNTLYERLLKFLIRLCIFQITWFCHQQDKMINFELVSISNESKLHISFQKKGGDNGKIKGANSTK